jgi:hypothetical protein
MQTSIKNTFNKVATSSQTSAANANVKQLRAPADWGELARDAAHLVSQRASQVPEIANRLIYVPEPKAATQFALALRQFLQSDLTQMGLIVAQKREDGMLVFDYDVQAVTPVSGMQVVVTTALGNGSRYLFRNTDVYLVNQSDVKLYDASMLPPPPAPPMPPTPTKTLGITGKP